MSSDQPIFTFNKEVITSGDMSGNLSSSVIDLAEVTGFALHASWTGTPTGVISAMGGNTLDTTTYVAVQSVSVGGSAGNYLLNVEKAQYRYLQIVYTFSSSSGTLNAHVSAKSI